MGGVFAISENMGAHMYSGIDSPIDCGKFINEIEAARATFVGRYYRSNTSSWPKLTVSEAKVLSAAGLYIVALWEGASDHASYFTYSDGVRDAAIAFAEAVQIGQPKDTPIYFAVDFDANHDEISEQINAYFRGIAAGFQAASAGSPFYQVGVYGSGSTCSWLLKNRRVTKTWLALSSGWSGSKDFDNWDIKQATGLKLGFDNDSDQAKDGFGGFQIQ